MNKIVFSVFVDNTSGVLSRVAGLFSRRGFNIDSLTVSETERPVYSRMTIVSHGDDQVFDQIVKQLAKLEDVESLTVELTGNQTKIEAFLNLLGKEKILEMVRTGVTGLERGSKARGEMWDD